MAHPGWGCRVPAAGGLACLPVLRSAGTQLVLGLERRSALVVLGLLGGGGKSPATRRWAVSRCVSACNRGGSGRKVGRRSFFGRKDRITRRRGAKRGPAHAPPGGAGERCFARRSYSHSRWRLSRRLMPRHCRGASLTMPPPAWQTRRRRSVATGATSASACCTAQGRSRR